MFAPQTCPILELFGIAQKFVTTSAADLAAAVSKLTGHASGPPKPTKSPGAPAAVTEPVPASEPALAPCPTPPSTPAPTRASAEGISDTLAPSPADSSDSAGLSRASSALTAVGNKIRHANCDEASATSSSALYALKHATQLIGQAEPPIPSADSILVAQRAEGTSTASAVSVTLATLTHASASSHDNEADEEVPPPTARIDETSTSYGALAAFWKARDAAAAQQPPALRLAPLVKKEASVAERRAELELALAGGAHAAEHLGERLVAEEPAAPAPAEAIAALCAAAELEPPPADFEFELMAGSIVGAQEEDDDDESEAESSACAETPFCPGAGAYDTFDAKLETILVPHDAVSLVASFLARHPRTGARCVGEDGQGRRQSAGGIEEYFAGRIAACLAAEQAC